MSFDSTLYGAVRPRETDLFRERFAAANPFLFVDGVRETGDSQYRIVDVRDRETGSPEVLLSDYPGGRILVFQLESGRPFSFSDGKGSCHVGMWKEREGLSDIVLFPVLSGCVFSYMRGQDGVLKDYVADHVVKEAWLDEEGNARSETGSSLPESVTGVVSSLDGVPAGERSRAAVSAFLSFPYSRREDILYWSLLQGKLGFDELKRVSVVVQDCYNLAYRDAVTRNLCSALDACGVADSEVRKRFSDDYLKKLSDRDFSAPDSFLEAMSSLEHRESIISELRDFSKAVSESRGRSL